MYCIHCGGKIGDEALFCTKCGKKIVRRQFEQKEIPVDASKTDAAKSMDGGKTEKQKFVDPETAKAIKGKIDGLKDEAASLGRKKIALIIALVATIAFWGGGFLSSYLPGLLNQVLLVIWIGGVIASIIMIRHNPLKDFGKAWRLFQGFGLIGLFLSYFAVCIVLIFGLVFPIVPLGLEYFQNKSDM